jgi:uncharacterized membrane-anchored protein
MKKITEEIRSHVATGPEVVGTPDHSEFQRRVAVRELSRAMRSSLSLTLHDRAELYRSQGFLWVAEKAGCNVDELKNLADDIDTMGLDQIKTEVYGLAGGSL